MSGRQTTMADMVPEVPKDVQDKADAYASALRSLGKAKEKRNTAEDALIHAMRDADLKEVRIDLGNRRIVIGTKDVVHVKKVKKDSDESDGDEE